VGSLSRDENRLRSRIGIAFKVVGEQNMRCLPLTLNWQRDYQQRLDTFWGSSTQMKIYIQGNHGRDRLSILACRSESPTAKGIDREIVHIASKTLRVDAKVCRPASGADNQRRHHRSVYLPLPRLEGWGMGFNDFWWSDSIATAEDLFLNSVYGDRLVFWSFILVPTWRCSRGLCEYIAKAQKSDGACTRCREDKPLHSQC